MKLYIAECYDRHISPVIRVFDSAEAAIAYAKNFVQNNARHKDKIEEQQIKGTLYYCTYSNEDDHVLVTEGTLNDT